jgi:hypothetical protein
MNYRIVPVESYTTEPVLQELITLVGTRQLSPSAAQAAAWHVANQISWQQLSSLKYDRVAAADVPQFSRQDLLRAQNLVATAQGRVKERQQTPEQPPVGPAPRTSRVNTGP